MASSLVNTSHGSSGVQSTSAARTFSPPSERAPAASVSNAERRPASHAISFFFLCGQRIAFGRVVTAGTAGQCCSVVVVVGLNVLTTNGRCEGLNVLRVELGLGLGNG